jgi:hypothetical protein
LAVDFGVDSIEFKRDDAVAGDVEFYLWVAHGLLSKIRIGRTKEERGNLFNNNC